MSISWLLDVDPAPALLVLPPAAESLDEAHDAIELWEFYSGKVLDPAQRLVVEVMMAQDSAGRWAAPTTGREMARQNGKGDELEVVELWGLVQRGEAILHTVHEAALLATQAQQRMLGVLESHADLRRLIRKVWRGTGQQMIEMTNGGVVWYRTRSGGGGRGLDNVDRVVVDEAQHAADEHISAITPTMLANPNPQLNAVGTAALAGKSGWWWRFRKRALSADPGAFGYIGHTADAVWLDENGRVVQEAIDPFDESLWMKANPALASGRTSVEYLREQLHRLGPAMFAQEHLCVWEPSIEDARGGPIDVDRWSGLTDGESLSTDETIRLALDAPPDRMTATFAEAGKRPDGLAHVSVHYHVPPQEMRDLVAMARNLTDRYRTALVLPPNSPAKAWRGELEAAGVPLDELTPAEYAEACGLVLAKVVDGALRHRGQPELNAAVEGLAVRSSGDVDVWARRSSRSNIAPLVAATCALVRVPDVSGRPYGGEVFSLLDDGDDDGWEAG